MTEEREPLFDALEQICQDSVECSVQQVRDYPEGSQVTDALKSIINAADTLRAVNDNALAWHAGEEGKARALNVIAVWTAEAIAGRLHPSVSLIEMGE